MKCKFNVGDVVQLKSGGPKMTVVAVSPDAVRVQAAYFDPQGGKNSFITVVEALKKAGR